MGYVELLGSRSARAVRLNIWGPRLGVRGSCEAQDPRLRVRGSLQGSEFGNLGLGKF